MINFRRLPTICRYQFNSAINSGILCDNQVLFVNKMEAVSAFQSFWQLHLLNITWISNIDAVQFSSVPFTHQQVVIIEPSDTVKPKRITCIEQLVVDEN